MGSDCSMALNRIEIIAQVYETIETKLIVSFDTCPENFLLFHGYCHKMIFPY